MGVDEGGLAVVQAGTVAATAAAAAVTPTPTVSAVALAWAAGLTIISTAIVTVGAECES